MARKKAIEYALLGVVLILIAALCAAAAFLRWAHGFSARDQPPALERLVARQLRVLANPRGIHQLHNPMPGSQDVLSEARAHFADHCAVCHGNDGRGLTEIGQHLYPRAPDMTLPETQSMTDGELFHVIKYGVRLTGMPAWGSETSNDDPATWKLVHFVRHLPQLTPLELEEMKELNPKSREETMTEEEEEQFLEGKDAAPPASPSSSPRRTNH
jgi:mono/diheme cytochrome c family protein